ncbi:MAG: hypothetical protein WBR15_05255 [Gammaproteobacteria bacterium]
MRLCATLLAILLAVVIFVMPCWAKQILPTQDQAAIYSLVLFRLIGPDDTYNGRLHPKKIYISEMLFAPAPAKVILSFYDALEKKPPFPPPPPPPPLPSAEIFGGGDVSLIPNDVKNLLKKAIRARGLNLSWANTEHSAPIKPVECGNEGGPLVISFSTLQEPSQGTTFVQGRLHCGPLSATSYYELVKIAGSWQVKRVMNGPMS